MAKKIRFPLEMENAVKVRTMEELRENFSLERILFYIADKKLYTWLRDRYLDDIAEKIEQLDSEDDLFNQKLCAIFDVEYDESKDVGLEKILERNQKIKHLKTKTNEEKWLDVLDDIAFEQEDLYDLLDEGRTTIYLCGEQFVVPISKSKIRYMGIDNPVVVIDSKEVIDFEERNIIFENVRWDEAYQKILDENKKDKFIFKEYKEDSYISPLLSSIQQQRSKNMYEQISTEMRTFKYDAIVGISEMRSMLLQEEIAGCGKKYIES